MHIDQNQNAARIIYNDGLIAFLTETVFGLGAKALNPIAVTKISELTEWPSFNTHMLLRVGYDDIK
jgi:L-threonylcarbamoyladenylate synthase